MKSIYIAEDHVLLSQGLKSLLEDNFKACKVSMFANGIDVCNALTGTAPEVIILDLNVPGKNGLEVLTEVKKRGLKTKVVIYTMYNDSKLVEKCKENGASAYLLKNTSDQELLSLLQARDWDDFYYGHRVRSNQDEVLFKDGFQVSLGLTNREKEIISCLADDMTSAEIGEKLFISPNTVNTHRKNLIKKLNVKSVAGVIKFAAENNLL
tara:strand:- start:1188 stop:1814 length:627 start_codon:yes stop_codon:yes gene_type:complete